MSHKDNRESAEKGMIFRDGHLVDKKEWEKNHQPVDTFGVKPMAVTMFSGRIKEYLRDNPKEMENFDADRTVNNIFKNFMVRKSLAMMGMGMADMKALLIQCYEELKPKELT